jgi:para-nitrobenzyl esterase
MGGVKVLLGSTLDEAEAFLAAHPRTAGLTHDEAQALALEVYGQAGQAGYASLRERFPRHSAGTLFSRLTSDEVFVRPAREFAARLLEGGASVHLFDFAFRPKGSRFGACHCLELPFVFGPTDAWSSAPMLSGGDPGTVERLSAAIRAAWISFIRTGKPASPVLPEWPAASPGNLVSMRLDEQPRLQVYGSNDG